MKPLMVAGVLVIQLGTALNVSAQVRSDNRGNHRVVVHDDRGRAVEMTVESPNKAVIHPELRIVDGGGGVLRYEFTLRVDSASAQPLRFFEFRCPEAGRAGNLAAARETSNGRQPVRAEILRGSSERLCSFDGLVNPGDALIATLETSLLPTIADARVHGKRAPIVWPTSDPDPRDDNARAMVDSLSGALGGWRSVTMVIPGRPAVAMVRDGGLARLQSDLDRVCSALHWLADRQLCVSLATDLNRARGEYPRNKDVARNALEAFIRRLETPVPVPAQGYEASARLLLLTNAKHLLNHFER